MTRLSVPDMHCDHCKASVETALTALPDAGQIAVDLDRGEVSVTGTTPAPALIAALGDVGFAASVIPQV